MRITTNQAIQASAITAVQWEETPCLMCGARACKPLLEASDALGVGLRFLIVQCSSCGLCYTNPRPNAESMRSFYPADYHCHRRKSIGDRDDFAGWRPSITAARLLDFGCGSGDFLRWMRQLGWDVVGLDAWAPPGDADVPIYSGTLPDPRWTDERFDLITMRQSLEHVHEPLTVLRAAHRLLTPGGQLFVSAPNFDSFASHWFGANWFGLDVPRHLTHFSPATLQAMLGRAGFDEITIRQERKSGWIRHSAVRAGGGILATRIGASIAGWWGRLIGQADCIVAVARRASSWR